MKTSRWLTALTLSNTALLALLLFANARRLKSREGKERVIRP